MEGSTHRVEESMSLRVGGAALGDEVTCHLIEDALAPMGVVQPGLGYAKQRVAQRERVEDACIEDCNEGSLRRRIRTPRDGAGAWVALSTCSRQADPGRVGSAHRASRGVSRCAGRDMPVGPRCVRVGACRPYDGG